MSAALRFSAGWLADACSGTWHGGEVSTNELAIDTRSLGAGAVYVALFGEKMDGHQFVGAAQTAGATGAVVAARCVEAVRAQVGEAFPLLVVEDGLVALQAMAKSHRQRLKATFVAVAGSNGKTTTKEMVASVLARKGRTHRTTGNLNNHIGVPLSLLRMDDTYELAAIEVGMNHPGELLVLGDILQPHHALITNIQPEHLEGLGTIENVAKAEGEIFTKVLPGGSLIWPGDDALAKEYSLPKSTSHRLVAFGESDECAVKLLSSSLTDTAQHKAVYRTTLGELTVILPQVGHHNARNAAAAIAVGLTLGMTLDDIKAGLESTPLVDRRLNIHRTEKLTLIDDCYNANPGSMAAAIEVLRALGQGRRKVAVLGDMLELGADAEAAHAELGRTIVEKKIDMLVVTGTHARTVSDAALEAGLHPEAVAFAPAVAPLLAWLKPRLKQGDVVLVKGSRGMRLERVVEAILGKPSVSGGAH